MAAVLGETWRTADVRASCRASACALGFKQRLCAFAANHHPLREQVLCQILRIVSFLSTQLPAPAPHCRAPEPTSNAPWPVVSESLQTRGTCTCSCTPAVAGAARLAAFQAAASTDSACAAAAGCSTSSNCSARLSCDLISAVVASDHCQCGAPGVQGLRRPHLLLAPHIHVPVCLDLRCHGCAAGGRLSWRGGLPSAHTPRC